MRKIKNPELGRNGAEKKSKEYLEDSLPRPICQGLPLVSYIIRRIFIENLISQPYTRETSLKVDRLLTLAEFLEGVGHVWN